MPPPEPLRRGEVRVLWAPLEEAPPPDALDADERSRAAARGSPRAAGSFRAGRALARELLSRCVPDVPPAAFRIRPEPGGRPRVVAPEAAGGLALSISHGRTAVAVAVAAEPVGVDVEGARRLDRPLELAARFFHPSERDELAALPPAVVLGAFLDRWALKEALGKAWGRGMAAVMGRAAFRLPEPPEPPRAEWDAALRAALGAPDDWRFRLDGLVDGARLAGGVRLATAARGRRGELCVERYAPR